MRLMASDVVNIAWLFMKVKIIARKASGVAQRAMVRALRLTAPLLL